LLCWAIYEQARLELLERYIGGSPNDPSAHLFLAIVYSKVGLKQKAQAEAAEVLRLNQRYALPPPEKWGQDVVTARLELAELSKAGLK
jgi:hypothetical protein